MRRALIRRWGQRVTYAMQHAHGNHSYQGSHCVQGVGINGGIYISILSVVVEVFQVYVIASRRGTVSCFLQCLQGYSNL